MNRQQHTPAASLREEPTLAELEAHRERRRQIEAAELRDNGVPTAMQRMWDEVLRFDGLGAPPNPAPEPEPIAAEIDEFSAKLVGREFMAARESVMNAARVLPLRGHADIHKRLNGLVNEISHIGAIVAERRSS